MTARIRIATSILLVKDRIQQYYAQDAQHRAALNKYKEKHGYCQGAISCMMNVNHDERLCKECLKQSENPQYRRRQSEYGRIRERERAEERKKREAKKKAVKQPNRKAA